MNCEVTAMYLSSIKQKGEFFILFYWSVTETNPFHPIIGLATFRSSTKKTTTITISNQKYLVAVGERRNEKNCFFV